MSKLLKLKDLIERGYKIGNFHLGNYGLEIKLLGIEGGKLQRETILVLKTDQEFNETLLYTMENS